MSSANCCALLRGKVHFVPPMCSDGRGWGGLGGVTAQTGTALLQPGPGVFVGNSSRLDVQQQREEFGEPDYTGSGEACTASILQGVDVSMSIKCLSVKNLELFLFGKSSVTGESECVINEKIPLGGSSLKCSNVIHVGRPLIDCDGPMSIEIIEPNMATTLLEGPDYKRSPLGFVLSRDITIADGGYALVSYDTAKDVSTLDAFTRSAIDIGIVYDGFNEVDGSRVMAHIYRIRLSASDVLSLITEGFGELNMSGKLRPICVGDEKKYMHIKLKHPDGEVCNNVC